VAAVRVGHRCHDGQAQPGTWLVAGPDGKAAERLEQPGYLVCRDLLAAVGDGDFGDARSGPGAGQHPSPGHVVPDGVVDEVAGQPFEQDPVPGDLRGLKCRADLDLPGLGGRADQVDGVFDRGGQVDDLGGAWSAVGAGQGQQCLDQFRGFVHGGADRGHHRLQLCGGGGWLSRGDVDQGAHLG
jgi:hypothetical protein